jgi:coenzyme Q-binding protein COQ10
MPPALRKIGARNSKAFRSTQVQPSACFADNVCRTSSPLQQRRNFLPNPFASGLQTVSASRTIQHPTRVIYNVISTVSSYSAFVPYCHSSHVTRSSEPTSNGAYSYPEEVKFTIGLTSNVSKDFWFCVYLHPETVVEAVAGKTETSLPPDQIDYDSSRPEAAISSTRRANLLMHLAVRWTLRSFPYKLPPYTATSLHTTHKNLEETSRIPSQETTQVNLTIEYQFVNPIYRALGAAAAPKVAEKIIEAFEDRVNWIGGRRWE